MTDFKVGDKVRRIRKSHAPEHYGVVGQVYEVLQMHGRNPQINSHSGGANRDEFELVEEVMHYEVGKPYLWFGGDCPLPKGTRVSIRCGSKDMSSIQREWTLEQNVEHLFWHHVYKTSNLVMFKVVSYPQPEPVKRTVTLELTEDQIKTIESVLAKEGKM